jgi:hypothetical protein
MDRYLYEVATKKQATAAELSRLEWEATSTASGDLTAFLKSAETKSDKFSDKDSPSTIAIFASLYALTKDSKGYPETEKFFSEFLALETTKTGIEWAGIHTAEGNVDASNVPSVASSGPKVQKLRSGIFMKKPTGKMYCSIHQMTCSFS